jgi:hypothetical protein
MLKSFTLKGSTIDPKEGTVISIEGAETLGGVVG